MKILKKVIIPKHLFENIVGYGNELLFEFVSQEGDKIKTNLIQEYHLLEKLVTDNILTKEDIIKNGIARETTKFNSYLGLFTVFSNLGAYYKIVDKYVIVFGIGEVQNGRNVMYISGVWEYE